MAVKTRTMTKAEVVSSMASKSKISKRQAEESLNTFMSCVRDSLRKGLDVRLIPFGSFEVRTRKARTGRNPRTGQRITIKARKVVRFKAGKFLKHAVR